MEQKICTTTDEGCSVHNARAAVPQMCVSEKKEQIQIVDVQYEFEIPLPPVEEAQSV